MTLLENDIKLVNEDYRREPDAVNETYEELRMVSKLEAFRRFQQVTVLLKPRSWCFKQKRWGF